MDMDEAGPGPSSGPSSRWDGRGPEDARVMLCERGFLNRADGSAQWCHGDTKVQAAVYGPRSTTARKEDSEKAVIEVTFQPKAGQAGQLEKQYEQIIRQTVEGIVVAALHPRTAISITLQVISDDGSLLGCALNAACCALVDAAIPMNRLYGGAVCSLSKSGSILIDPTAKEEKEAQAVVCLAFITQGALKGGESEIVVGEGVLSSYTLGHLKAEQYFDIMEISRQYCGCIAQFAKGSLEKALVAGR